MKEALLFQNGEKPLVSAEEVKEGKYDPKAQYVDPEYEFRVSFVRGAKHGGGPYFRYYYSYEDFARKYPDRKDKYQMVANMRHFEESQWHRYWESKLSDFCKIEYFIKDPSTKVYKRADAYYEEGKTCIEFQHSFIDFDFEKRCEFYKALGFKIVWLYDLTRAEVVEDSNREEILEDNARGFFRIAENPDNLANYPIFIQVKGGTIYRITKLGRKQIEGKLQSTIRYFEVDRGYSEEEFIAIVKEGNFDAVDHEEELHTLDELWDKNYKSMVVEDTTYGKTIFINRDNHDEMFRTDAFIQYKYVTWNEKSNTYTLNSYKDYSLAFGKEDQKIWKLLSFEKKQTDKES